MIGHSFEISAAVSRRTSMKTILVGLALVTVPLTARAATV
jgi:hypothetical protein